MLDYWKNAITKNYANFNGRARRSEYWYYLLMNIIIMVGLQILIGVGAATKVPILAGVFGIVYLLYALGTFIPSLAVAVRRLHDAGKSGWFLLISLIPLVGSIWLLVILCTEGTAGENEYGADPKNQSSMNDDALDSHLAN
jgi:uncharacterized membrane protein YhaH (DUF805 family)